MGADWTWDWRTNSTWLQLVIMLECRWMRSRFNLTFRRLRYDVSKSINILGPGGPSMRKSSTRLCVRGVGTDVWGCFTSPLHSPVHIAYFLMVPSKSFDEWHDVGPYRFWLVNCPFDVDIELVEDACAGDCGSVQATIIGDSGADYDYSWSHTPLNQEQVNVCTDVALLISVTVTDPVTLQTATDQFNYIPLENPVT